MVDLVVILPLDRLKSVYDFALFLKQQQVQAAIVDIFGETDEIDWRIDELANTISIMLEEFV